VNAAQKFPTKLRNFRLQRPKQTSEFCCGGIPKLVNSNYCNISIVKGISGNKASGLSAFISSSGLPSAHHHHQTFAASTSGILRGILRRIHLGVTDRGLFYRPIHSVKAALLKRRRRRRYSKVSKYFGGQLFFQNIAASTPFSDS
jgi:hypothetical protein